jgi:hypothetical protein
LAGLPVIRGEGAEALEVAGVGQEGVRGESFFDSAKVEELPQQRERRARSDGFVRIAHRANDTIPAKMFETYLK